MPSIVLEKSEDILSKVVWLLLLVALINLTLMFQNAKIFLLDAKLFSPEVGETLKGNLPCSWNFPSELQKHLNQIAKGVQYHVGSYFWNSEMV